MDKKPKRQSTPEVEAFRRSLYEMGRPACHAVARRAGVSISTIDKFRMGHLTVLGADKWDALNRAIRKTERV